MTRLFLSCQFTLASATMILLGVGAMPASAEPWNWYVPTTAPRQGQRPEDQYRDDAIQLLKKGEIGKAIWVLEGAARKFPELPRAYVMMYQILLQMKEPKAARLQLEEVIGSVPSDPEPYVILGTIALQEQRVAEAALDFDKAKHLLKKLLAEYPDAVRRVAVEQQMLSGVAQVAELREDWEEAEKLLRDLLKLTPVDLFAHRRLARVLFWQHKAQDAYDILKAAKGIDRENAKKNHTREIMLPPEAIMAQYYERFEGAAMSNKTGDVERWFKAALKRAPDDLPTREVVAEWALEHGKLAFAKEQAEAALRIEAADASLKPEDRRYSGSHVGRMLHGQIALWEKDWPTAERYFEMVILEDPNDFAARNGAALALVEQDDPAKNQKDLPLLLQDDGSVVLQHDSVKKRRALALAEGNYAADKNNASVLSTLGWVYFRRGQFEQAELALDQTLNVSGGKMDPDSTLHLTMPQKLARIKATPDIRNQLRHPMSTSAFKATGGNIDPDMATYVAHLLHHRQQDWEAKGILEDILKNERSFAMKPEAQKLYEKVKDAKQP